MNKSLTKADIVETIYSQNLELNRGEVKNIVEDLLALMQKDVRILENFTGEIASAAYMLQQRVELLSYGGIAQKAAYWLLMQSKQTGKAKVAIPGSVSRWAMILNVSRPSLHRELKRLESEGVISYSPPAIEILDQDALQDYLSQ